MTRILILFASSHGHTRDIASAIERQLRARGHIVDLVDARRRAPSPSEYESVVVGSRVHSGRHAACIRRYVRRHREELERIPTAFFSVSMSAAGPKPAPYVQAFIDETGWRPGRTISIAGALPYTRYNPLVRFVMKRISRAAGQPTDTSRDHDFTDWASVRAFADELAGALERPAMPSPPVPGVAHA